MNGAFPTRAALFLIGFSASISQIVLLRELLAGFGGNEISIGVTLAGWLLWTAAGSAAAGPLTRRARLALAGIETLLACLLPATIIGLRAARAALQSAPGESLGPGLGLAVAMAGVGPLCLLSGALFTVGSALRAMASGARPEQATREVYWLEALGSASGGALAALALTRELGALQIAWLLGLLNLLAACGLTVRRVWVRAAIAGALVVLAGWAWLPNGVPAWERRSLERLWPGYRLVAVRNSPYGSLAVVESQGVRALYENGQLLFSAPDPENVEESVHYALLQHPAPQSLLLIGGGFNGSLAEAARHATLSEIEDVEFDPAVPELARRYFADQWQPVAAQPERIRVRIDDGRRYLKSTARSFDVIIVNLPEPRTAQLNRFYTLEFFREAAARLSPGGIFSFRLPASETYLSPGRAEFLRSVNRTVRAVFPEVAVMPGETAHFFAAESAGVLVRSADDLLARLRRRGLTASYVREYYLPFRMSPERVNAFEQAIRPQPGTRLNRDFEPIAYYFSVALWSSQFDAAYARIFRSVASIPFGRVALWLALLPAAALAARILRPSPGRAAASCAAAMGFTLIGLEILLLLGFQALYGYVYQELAILIAAFMAGMALGSWITRGAGCQPAADCQSAKGSGGSTTCPMPSAPPRRALAIVQAAAAAAPVLLCLSFLLRLPGAAGQALFLFLALASGLLGGCQFRLASHIYFASHGVGGPGESACPANPAGLGTLYALDLAGSAAGAALFAVWLIPVFGFFRAALLTAELNLAAALLALPARKPRRPI